MGKQPCPAPVKQCTECGAAMSGTVEWEREGPGPDSLGAAVVVRVFKPLLLYMLLCVCVSEPITALHPVQGCCKE